MKDVYLLTYSVCGVKTIDEPVELSFFKKTITRPVNTQKYNVKAIYGMNGSGKSAIVTSVKILKSLIINPNYLNNPLVQEQVRNIINQKMGYMSITAEFLMDDTTNLYIYRYTVTIKKDHLANCSLIYEKFDVRKAGSEKVTDIFEVNDGCLTVNTDDDSIIKKELLKRTANLLSKATLPSLFIDLFKKEQIEDALKKPELFLISLINLSFFGNKLYVYLENEDDHIDYAVRNMLGDSDHDLSGLLDNIADISKTKTAILSPQTILVSKRRFDEFKTSVDKLSDFIRIFKYDLVKIDIDRKEDKEFYRCDLIMDYGAYRISAEFESTGIKKLIRLFTYIRAMVNGDIVFVDELDSNLHDVYLCALLEYLMEFGQGQLCFTTHNVGPMDVLKQNKKSIDFLSIDHKIYSWKTNGNYSPSKLYRQGMIQGSPFNIDAMDFIGIFDADSEDA